MTDGVNNFRRILPDEPTSQEVYEAGRKIITGALNRAKVQFEKHEKSLHYREWTAGNFRVSAGREEATNVFFIMFDRIVPWVLFEGVSAFVDMAANRLGGEEYSEIFSEVVGSSRPGVLPEGWSILECRDTIFEKALVWLFHHELGHLFQDHERIRRESAPDHVDITLFVDEAMTKSEALASDTQLSWTYHATELAADHQALHYSLFYENLEDSVASAEHISLGSIWCFVCAVAYMFHYFYGDRPYADVSSTAEGSHPDPTIRLATLTGHLVQLLDWKSVRSNASNLALQEDVENAVTCAEVAVGVYWALTHGDKSLVLTDVLGRRACAEFRVNGIRFTAEACGPRTGW